MDCKKAGGTKEVQGKDNKWYTSEAFPTLLDEQAKIQENFPQNETW